MQLKDKERIERIWEILHEENCDMASIMMTIMVNLILCVGSSNSEYCSEIAKGFFAALSNHLEDICLSEGKTFQ